MKPGADWRLIIEDGVSASSGLAADETLARRVGAGESRATLRLYSYRSHCALVGRFQNVSNEIQLDFCRSQGVAVNRRPTGGGAILMGADQLGVALTLPATGIDTAEGTRGEGARQLMARFSAGLIGALDRLGVPAGFQHKNDVEVDGKKIAGLGIYQDATGGLLFHASLLVDLDIALMLRVLRTPFEKISDKAIATVAARISTLRRELGRNLSLDEARDEVAKGYAVAFGVELTPGEFLSEEREAIASLEEEKYRSNEWIANTTPVPDGAGSARMKTDAGLLDVRVSVAGRMIKSVLIEGDFFASQEAVARLEASLRWHRSDPLALRQTLAAIFREHGRALSGLPLESLLETLRLAAADAENEGPSKAPYGCFVKPG